MTNINLQIVREISKDCNIEQIENSLVSIYLQKFGKNDLKNTLLKSVLENVNDNIKKDIETSLYKRNIKINLEVIERIFELLIPEKERKLNGAYYTPKPIVKYIIERTLNNELGKVFDPSCGCGAFLLYATQYLSNLTKKSYVQIIQDYIYGCDISHTSIRRVKVLLSLLCLENGEDPEKIRFNLVNKDSLKIDFKTEFKTEFKSGGFDAVVGNPPYIKFQNLDVDTRKYLKAHWFTTQGGNFNIFFPFIELGINSIRDDGKVGYIIPNYFFSTFAGKNLRKYLHLNKFIEEIIDFNHYQVFKDSTTYTCIIIISKDLFSLQGLKRFTSENLLLKNPQRDTFKFSSFDPKKHLNNLKELKFIDIPFSSIKNDRWRLLSKKDRININKIETIGKPLKQLTKIHSGIATLRDEVYIIKNSPKNEEFIKKVTKEGQEYFIENSITRPIRKISNYDDEKDILRDNTRIIFPYVWKNGRYEIISEKQLSSQFPLCYKYLLSQRDKLTKRDKGKKKYPTWFAYGRTQGFTYMGKKLLTPTFSNKPKFMFDPSEDSLFCNGYAVYYNGDIKILQKILNSVIMDYYLKHTSVELENGFQCYQKNFIERFGIPNLNPKEKNTLNIATKNEVDNFLINKYNISIEKNDILYQKL